MVKIYKTLTTGTTIVTENDSEVRNSITGTSVIIEIKKVNDMLLTACEYVDLYKAMTAHIHTVKHPENTHLGKHIKKYLQEKNINNIEYMCDGTCDPVISGNGIVYCQCKKGGNNG